MAKRKIRTKFWRTDWFLGLAVVVAVLFVQMSTEFVERLELQLYDFATQLSGKKPSDQIAVIAIDDQSIRNIGRWPWPRDVQAKVISQLADSKAKVIVNTTLLFEPESDKNLGYIQKIKELSMQAEFAGQPLSEAVQKLASSAQAELDNDAKLASSMQKASNVLLAATFELGEPTAKPEAASRPDMAKHFLPDGSAFSFPSKSAQYPTERFVGVAAGVGHLNSFQDIDGIVRRDPLLVGYFGQAMPSLSLLAAAKALNYSLSDIKVDPAAEQVKFGKVVLKTDAQSLALTQFYGKSAFPHDSFYDVYSGKISPARYAGKIVVIGGTAAGVGNVFSAPGGVSLFAADFMAHSASALLSQHQYVLSEWGGYLSLLAFLAVAAYVMAALPRLSAAHGAVVSATLLVALLGASVILLAVGATWVKLALAAFLLLLGHLVLTSKRYFFTEVGKAKSDTESADTNRMMGLALQGQGRLDEAFDRFRRVPLNEDHGPALMDNMYNLALDFERKRQFNKAQAVYEFMSSYDKDYKDLPAKLNRAKNLSETVILGGGGSHPGGTMILGDGSVEKPKLGRYDVEKELGKGAMGVVYLGRDPKIGRVVAIKTMALSQEFEGDELVDARERFFREAETAGRLQHPQIVTIYDAGEEHDLAFIAMEFLKGKDLVDFTKDGALLPVEKVVSICARVAEALSYAHKQNVVHRDIKPANVMYELSSDTVKVTDFGIARITDSSKTKTGLVLGTPSFMSPEQIAGKKVDGRSDLYSLGVMLFQMLTGVLPFRGESMAELMYKIANEEAPDIRIIRGEISGALANVVAVALSKRVETRYQDGEQFAADLKAALSGVSTQAAPPAPRLAAPVPARASDASLEKTQTMQANEKTVVMHVGATDTPERTVVLDPPTQPFIRDEQTYDSTVPFMAPGKWSDNSAPADPFEKTVITPPHKPGGPQA